MKVATISLRKVKVPIFRMFVPFAKLLFAKTFFLRKILTNNVTYLGVSVVATKRFATYPTLMIMYGLPWGISTSA